MSKLSLDEKFLDIILNEYANLIFNKCYAELEISEIDQVRKYMKDISNPVWKPVYNKNGQITDIEISNIGTIRDRYDLKERTPYKNTAGYLSISIGKNQNAFVHRLVAQAFIPNPENKREVNHINGKKDFNWVGNLEWNTRLENAAHAAKTGLMLKGSKQPVSAHTEEDAHQVCKLLEKGMKIKDIINETGLSKTFIIGILYRGEWSHISKNYNLPKAKSFLDENMVHSICKMLENGDSVPLISKTLGVDDGRIYPIRSGVSWRRISNQYNIPGLEKNNITNPKLSDQINELFKSGITDSDEIINRLNLIPNSSSRKYIRRLKIRYDKKIGIS